MRGALTEHYRDAAERARAQRLDDDERLRSGSREGATDAAARARHGDAFDGGGIDRVEADLDGGADPDDLDPPDGEQGTGR